MHVKPLEHVTDSTESLLGRLFFASDSLRFSYSKLDLMRRVN